MRPRLFLFAVAACLTAGLLFALPGVQSSADEEDPLIDCARQEADRNFNRTFSDFSCVVTSYRKVWKLDGRLHKNNVVVKKIYAKQPDKRKQTFLSGTMNGQPAQENDFLYEKFGLDSSTQFFDVECLRADMAGRFRLTKEKTVKENGKTWRVISFASLDPKKTNMQTGRLLLPPNYCSVHRLEGRFVHQLIQRNEVEISAVFGLAAQSTWMPREIRIEGQVALGPLKRRIEARNVFDKYVFDVGLPDSMFDD